VLVRLSDQRVVLTNPAAADLFEIPFEQAPGQQAQQFYVRPEDLEGLASRIEQGHSAKRSSVQLRSAKGRVFWATISGQRVDFEGEPCLLAGVYDITAQKELEERLRELATRDALTGVYNRRYLEEVTAQEHSRVERGTSAPFALLVVDADHFKEVNDKYGHPTGDDVLAALAQACAGALRRGDVFARIGGEEFAAMLPETDASAAGEVGERLRRAVEALEVSTDHGVFLRPTVSIGGAVAKPEESVGSVLDRADKAMYTAKDRGRNKVVISDA
jgi:diguanylate cyclase (GGDEF)-like protein/PAS domain S-box-containing protein